MNSVARKLEFELVVNSDDLRRDLNDLKSTLSLLPEDIAEDLLRNANTLFAPESLQRPGCVRLDFIKRDDGSASLTDGIEFRLIVDGVQELLAAARRAAEGVSLRGHGEAPVGGLDSGDSESTAGVFVAAAQVAA